MSIVSPRLWIVVIVVGGRALAFSQLASGSAGAQTFVIGSETGALIRGMCPAVPPSDIMSTLPRDKMKSKHMSSR